jgi:hypothetical protein
MNRAPCLRTLIVLTLTLATPGAHADMTTEWVAIATNSTQRAQQAPEAAAPSLRTVQEAVAAAAAAARNRHNIGNESSTAAAERHDAAVAVAAFAVLEHLYPDQRDSLEARLAVSFSRIPESAAKADGAVIGREVANKMLAAGEVAARNR